MEHPRIVIIGSGNVATHLARAFDRVGDVVQVYSLEIDNARRLAEGLRDADSTDDLSSIYTDADYYVISVKDDAISEVVQNLPAVDGVVVHTSGSVGIDALQVKSQGVGVLYPLQTFSKHVDVEVSEIPFFIEADSTETLARIEAFTRKVSENVYHADSSQRTILHIAAVFGCNFVNHLLDISSQILNSGGYELDVLKPLLEVTINKAMTVGPHNAQTGPAVRKDTGIVNKHISALPNDLGQIYDVLSQHIIESF